MSLRWKFSIILGMLAITLGASIALSIWGIRFLERELALPLRSSQPVLAGLHSIKRLGEEQASDLGIGRFTIAEFVDTDFIAPDPDQIAPSVLEKEEAVIDQLDLMAEVETLRLRSGVSTTENLRRRSLLISETINRWSKSGDHAAYESLIDLIESRHELIERIEGRIIEDAALANTYGERIKIIILTIIAVGVLGAALVATYSFILLRRWVLSPVESLRVGAQHYAKGDFEYSTVVQTGDELGQLGDEFNHMATMIQAMQDERVERERLAAMGEMAQRTVHNLRTPLAGIRALAETTQDELLEDSELHQIQGRIIDSVDRFEGWLQGMLRVSSPLELQHRNYDAQALISSVIESHRGAAESRSVTIEFEHAGSQVQSKGDPDQLAHALTAILSNAIDYAPSATAIQMKLDFDDADWKLVVRDFGPGIPIELQESIFRPYFTTRKGGTGIGLALVKRICEQHGGSVEVQSPIIDDSDPGTRFVVQIPREALGERKA